MQTLLRDMAYSLRSLTKNSGFATAAIATLAIGIGSNTALFSFVNTLFWKPFPYRAPERLVRLYISDEARGCLKGNFCFPDFVD